MDHRRQFCRQIRIGRIKNIDIRPEWDGIDIIEVIQLK